MNTLFSMINVGSNALTAHQNRLALHQQNIANASTPGYRRQRVGLSTFAGAHNVGALKGVALGATRSIDAPLTDRQLVSQRAGFGYHSARAQVGAVVESYFDPVNGTDITGQVNEFFASLRGLSSNPGNGPERREVVARAEAMARSFRQTASSLRETQGDIAVEAQDAVGEVNARLERIAALDREIQVSGSGGAAVGDLVDERDRLVTEVANDLQLRVTRTGDGMLHLATESGHAVVHDGRANTLTAEVGDDGDLSFSLASGVGGATRLDDLGGRLGGLASSHNDMIGARLSELDQLAFDFASAFNAAHSGGVALDGSTGNNLFTIPGSAEGAAELIAVDPAILDNADLLATTSDPSTLPGGSDLLQQLIALEDQALSGGESLHGGLVSITQSIGVDVRDANEAMASSSASIAQLENVQASISGVSLEEELLSINEAQRAFEAALRIIETTEEMMDSVMMLGA